jgi:hypothetical protein
MSYRLALECTFSADPLLIPSPSPTGSAILNRSFAAEIANRQSPNAKRQTPNAKSLSVLQETFS